MLSRVADSLYWMARYIERAEHTARIIGVQLNLMLDQTSVSDEDRWARLLQSLGDPTIPGSDHDPSSLSRALLYNPACRASITRSINTARENCRQVRNQISSEMWEQLNRLYHYVRRFADEERRHANPLEFLLAIDEGLHLFHGITASTMSHNEAWHFIEIGRFLERATNTAILLDVAFRHPLNHLEWIGLLRSCTAFEAYCRARTADVRVDWAAEFLLLDAEFPHSIRFSVDRLEKALSALSESSELGAKPTRLAGRLKASLQFANIDEIMQSGIRHHLDGIQRQCDQIHEAAQGAYIDYTVEEALEA